MAKIDIMYILALI